MIVLLRRTAQDASSVQAVSKRLTVVQYEDLSDTAS
jgi:hypothetical protein